MQIKRRNFIAALAGTAATGALARPGRSARAGDTAGFTFDTVKDQAVQLAKQPYDADPAALPDSLKALDYTHFRMINYRSSEALWQDAGLFRIEMFHRGFQYDRKVTIHTIESGEVREIDYSSSMFDFGQNNFPTNFERNLGFAGFRLHFPLNRPDYFDEFAVFQGASYYRLIGRGQQYGLSGRGLAIDTAGPQGEEFPAFTTFWIERPSPEATTIVIYALLDSKSTTGAYRFELSPDTETEMRVEAVLYPRLDIRKLGLAPLTSMFLHGKLGNRPFSDLRPEVHDSDGLALHTGNGEWVWRPLMNPRALRVSAFSDRNPRGFGLMQRETDFHQYEDVVEHYQRRPSLWIEPEGDWGKGAVELVEIPSDAEINDNMAAYWVPEQPVKAGVPVAFAYRARTLPGSVPLPPIGRTVGTRTGPAVPVDAARDDHKAALRFWLDFTGGDIPSLADSLPVQAIVTVSTGKVDDIVCQKLDPGVWRAAFTFTPDGKKDAEMRTFLKLRDRSLSETWTFRWTAE
jgi:glucans biosynthesis protein